MCECCAPDWEDIQELRDEINSVATTVYAALTLIADNAERPHTLAEALRELMG